MGLLVGILLVVAAGCGNSGGGSKQSGGDTLSSVLAQVKGLTGKARAAKLLELAVEEGGNVTLYTSQGSAKAADLVSAFEDSHEGVSVALYRANSETILPRLAEEAKAGFHGADVIHVQGLAMTSLHDDGLLGDYTSPVLGELIPGAGRDAWTVDSINSFVISRNTKLVSEAEAPKSWEDLADPRWQGKLGLEAGDVDWYKTLHDYFVQDEGKSEQEADRIFEAMARNALVVRGHTNMAQLMAAGEVELSVNYASTIDMVKADGAPVDWRPAVGPLIQEPEGSAPAADPPHPAAALLLLEWQLSPEGQKVFVASGAESVRPELAAAPNTETKLIDTVSLAKVDQEWTDRFEKLLRLGKEAPDSG